MRYWEAFVNGYTGYFDYLWREITFQYDYKPWWENYFWWLILVSVFFFALELARPWRKEQPRFRKDFALDVFYMFFNFFLFSLLAFNGAFQVFTLAFNDFFRWALGLENLVALNVQALPVWGHLLIGFVVRDFVQWWIHRLLHRSTWLWEFHKVHHSVEEMGFAAHLRYHWMENVVYRTLEYLPLAMIGIGLNDFFIIHIFTLAVGHYNHANIYVSARTKGLVFGLLSFLFLRLLVFPTWEVLPTLSLLVGSLTVGTFALSPLMKYIFNSPEMHIWHHSLQQPEGNNYGTNFGITLSIWDYLFRTAWMPANGRDIPLGFAGIEDYPKTFTQQSLHGWQSTSKEKGKIKQGQGIEED